MIILRLLTRTSNVLVYFIEFKYGMRSNHNVLLIYLFISWGKKTMYDNFVLFYYTFCHDTGSQGQAKLVSLYYCDQIYSDAVCWIGYI